MRTCKVGLLLDCKSFLSVIGCYNFLITEINGEH